MEAQLKSRSNSWSSLSLYCKSLYNLYATSVLGKKLALGLFCLLLVVVIAGSVRSWYQTLDHHLATVDAEYTGLIAALAQANKQELVRQLEQRLQLPLSQPHRLLGYAVYTPKQPEIVSGGNHELLGTGRHSHSRIKRYFSQSLYYDTRAVGGQAKDGAESAYSVFVRVDVSSIPALLTSQMWRTLLLNLILGVGLVLLMLATLAHKVLNPLSRIGQSFRTTSVEMANSAGLDENTPAALQNGEPDEFEELEVCLTDFQVHNTMARERTDRSSQFLKLSTDLVWEADRRFQLTHVSGKLARQPGSGGAQSFEGASVHRLMTQAGVDADLSHEILQAIKVSGFWEGKIPDPDPANETRTIRVVAQPIKSVDNKLDGFRGIVLDTTEQNILASQLEYQANHDPMTGLANRRSFDTQLDTLIDTFDQRVLPCSICMLDLDQFKTVNDSCGHAAGDLLLIQVTKLLTSAVRSNDMVARVGGDEFCIILDNCTIEKASEIAEKIRSYIDSYRFNWRGVSYAIGVSVGIVELSDEFNSASELMNAADTCCYRAKRNGRNQIQLHRSDDEMLLLQKAEMEMINSISSALEDQKLVLYYQQLQPCIVDNGATGNCADSAFVEVLSRIERDEQIMELPQDFIPVAERFNLLPEIDRYVCTEVFDKLRQEEAALTASGKQLKVCINLSRYSIVDPAFQSFLSELIENAGFDVSTIYFEIPDDSFSSDAERAKRFVEIFSRAGCGITLDGFGCGSLSVSQIHGLPVSCLKLDSSLTRELGKNTLSDIVLRSIIDAAPMLGLELIAQHVEDDINEQQLMPYGFEYLQGYHYHKPQRLEKFGSLRVIEPIQSNQTNQSKSTNDQSDDTDESGDVKSAA